MARSVLWRRPRRRPHRRMAGTGGRGPSRLPGSGRFRSPFPAARGGRLALRVVRGVCGSWRSGLGVGARRPRAWHSWRSGTRVAARYADRRSGARGSWWPGLGVGARRSPRPGARRTAARARPAKRSPFTGARLLAWTGGAVTLLGVVLLLALAASRGWFTPPARVGVRRGAGRGPGRARHVAAPPRDGPRGRARARRHRFRTLYLVDAAATAIFGYLPALPALVLGPGHRRGRAWRLADRWRSELLAGGVVVGAAVLAPALADGWLLVALVLVLQLAALPVVLRRRWAVLMLLAAAGPVLYGLRAVVVERAPWPSRGWPRPCSWSRSAPPRSPCGGNRRRPPPVAHPPQQSGRRTCRRSRGRGSVRSRRSSRRRCCPPSRPPLCSTAGAARCSRAERRCC